MSQAIPIPVVLHCPHCHKQHIDEGVWATRPHRTHQCVDDAAGYGCGKAFTPSGHRTFGVKQEQLVFETLDDIPWPEGVERPPVKATNAVRT